MQKRSLHVRSFQQHCARDEDVQTYKIEPTSVCASTLNLSSVFTVHGLVRDSAFIASASYRISACKPPAAHTTWYLYLRSDSEALRWPFPSQFTPSSERLFLCCREVMTSTTPLIFRGGLHLCADFILASNFLCGSFNTPSNTGSTPNSRRQSADA